MKTRKKQCKDAVKKKMKYGVVTLAGEHDVYKFTNEEKKEFAGKFNYAIKHKGDIRGFTTLKKLNEATNYYGINRFNEKSWDLPLEKKIKKMLKKK